MRIQPEHIHTLKNLIDIGAAKAATVLNEMVGTAISLDVPEIKLNPSEDPAEGFRGEKFVGVELRFEGPLSGAGALVFPSASASKLVSILTGEDADSSNFDSTKIETITEIGNIVINHVVGSICNILDARVSFHIPDFSEDCASGRLFTDRSGKDQAILVGQTRFSMDQLEVNGEILLLLDLEIFSSLLSRFDIPVGSLENKS